jgi:hypothetical protein
MPERWQDELKKLRREEMPDGVRARAEAGPRRELPADGRQRLVAGVVAFALFIAAGAFAWRAFEGGNTTGTEPTPGPTVNQIVLELEGNDGAPTATLSSGDASQNGVREGYTWCDSEGQCVTGTADFAAYPPVTEYLPVVPRAAIETTGDGWLTRLVIRTTGGDSSSPNAVADTDGTGAVVPAEPGRYLIWISASWGERNSATYYFGIDVPPPSDHAPDLLHLTCTPDSATLDSSVVRAQADGVHVSVDASAAVAGADIVAGTTPEEFFGVGLDERDDGTFGIPIAPGMWSVGCYEDPRGAVGPSDIGTSRVASFTVIDPDRVYTPVDLACAEPTSRLFAVTGGTPSSGVDGAYEPSPLTVRESVAAVPGILPSDLVREAGYADGPGFKSGPLYTVLRDGRAVARLSIPVEVSGSWSVSVDACPGTGVGPDAPPGAAGPTPDTAVVRCVESRTEMSTPIVNAQADGLHLEVENSGGAQAVTVVGGWERERTFTVPIADQGVRASIVIPVRPGRVQISCRSNGETDPGDDPFADRGSDGLQLQDPTGFFLPYAPSCYSSDELPLEPPDARILPSGEAYVRGNLSGIQADDVVERAGYLEGRGDAGPWRVVRDGEIIAQVDYPSLEGITCRGSGITGA